MKRESDFFFEEWAFLASIDPAAFERRRRQVIAEFLRTSGQQRACGELLQRRIDVLRERIVDPRESLVAMARMLSEQLNLLGEHLDAMRDVLGKLCAAEKPADAELLLPH